MSDIQYLIGDPEEFPLCPLCDQPIFTYEEARIASAFCVKCLVHESSYQEAQDDE